MSNYSYPINPDWSTEEMIEVISFLNLVEEAYESVISIERFDDQYQRYRRIVNSIAGEKQMDKEFEAVSGYSIYKLRQKRMDISGSNKLSMK